MDTMVFLSVELWLMRVVPPLPDGPSLLGIYSSSLRHNPHTAIVVLPLGKQSC